MAGQEMDKSLYMQDLEERARLRGKTVDEVHQEDQRLLSRARPSQDCLRPDEVMECAADASRLSHRSWTHFQDCKFCQGLVAFAKPDAGRAARMAAQLAALPDESGFEAAPPAPRVVRWADAVMGGVDRTFSGLWKAAPAFAVACIFCIFAIYVRPNLVLTNTPSWTWTNGLLERGAVKVLDKGDAPRASFLASELIKRDPDNLSGYLLRYQALVKEGKNESAEKEAATMIRKLLSTMKPEDQALTLGRVFATRPPGDRLQLLQVLKEDSATGLALQQ